MRVLVVDDEPSVREMVSRALRLAGLDVATAEDGSAALDLVRVDPPDAIVLDVMMPRMDGIETCCALRAEGHGVPVLMMTARDSAPYRVAGLAAGADDYLVKPFALPDLIARVRALLRRPAPSAALALDPTGQLLMSNGRRATLNTIEYRLAEAFLDHPGLVLGKAALFEHVWHYDFGGASTILDPYLDSLDSKLAALGWRLVTAPEGYELRALPH
ncbi:response regulator transcription factor [Planosporangium flavigriseum]|uniref:DNA-binding response regulator n=1 Tax=Planosporangium flavigriseum TaxID=373681 RepID=A0A8J3LLX9_9ACTN|nr:response regulator transcription factor [Planosporangium flavigriseum]GIG74137.1 DNA-binding response regulator [Planosporangium flavigriseum]